MACTMPVVPGLIARALPVVDFSQCSRKAEGSLTAKTTMIEAKHIKRRSMEFPTLSCCCRERFGYMTISVRAEGTFLRSVPCTLRVHRSQPI